MRGDSLARIVADLNRTPRGWFGYFKDASRYIPLSLRGAEIARARGDFISTSNGFAPR